MRNETNESSVIADAEDSPSKSPRKTTKKVVKKAAAKVVKKAADSNAIPLKALCKQLNIEPRLARRKLRKAKISGHGERDRWTFRKDSPQYEKAREALRA